MNRYHYVVIVFFWAFVGAFTVSADINQTQFSVDKVNDNYRIALRSENEILLHSPDQGLWSVAMGWKEDWPDQWRHAHPSSQVTSGEWTILKGEIETPQGVWRLSDSYRLRYNAVQCIRRFEWHGEKTAEKCTLSVRFQSPGKGDGVLMPGILYYGNPSGAKSGRVPVYTGAVGEESIFEEHRFPMPFTSMEWRDNNKILGAALHSMPSPAPYGELPDQWWSMGVVARDEGAELTLLSGPCASNGKRSVIKALQPGFVPYNNVYLNVPPGGVIEKTFYLEVFPVEQEGAAFQRPLATSLKIMNPYSTDDFLSFREIIESKYKFALTRWYDKDGIGGFRKYPDKNFFVIGWCGQAAALGYALQALEPELKDERIPRMVQGSLDQLSTAQFYEGGFHTWYNADTQEWSRHEPLSQGQGMLSFARAITIGKQRGRDCSKWITFLKKAADFHAERILKDDWRPKSTDEGFFIAPLCYAYRIFDDAKFLAAAEKAGRHYAERHVSMQEPYWGGTLDASCEDKEGAFAALQGFIELYETTDNPEYLKWAQHACDVALTYTVTWDIDMPPGRLRDHNFKTRGWTVVSPQNQHIDVFGVLIAPDIYRVGIHTKREDLKKIALVMYRSCGQLIDPYGSQGEQPQHTNYAQRGNVDDIYALRGGYNETWTVFWITAHFLNAAALFEDMGVNVWGGE